MDHERRKGRVSLTVVFSTILAGLTAVSAAIILAVNAYSSFTSVAALLKRDLETTVNSLKATIDADRERIERGLETIARLYGDGVIVVDDLETMDAVFRQFISGNPMVSGTNIFDYERGAGVLLQRESDRALALEEPMMADIFQQTTQSGEPQWQEPFYPLDVGATILLYSFPLIDSQSGRSIGALTAGAALEALQAYALEFARPEIHKSVTFIYDDRLVLAASDGMGEFKPGAYEPLATLPYFENTILGVYLDEQARGIANYDKETGVRLLELNGEWFAAFSAPADFGSLPIEVVSFFPAATITGAIDTLRASLWFSLGMIIVAILIALLIGARLSGKLRHVTHALDQLSLLRLEQAENLQPSRIKEVQTAVTSVRQMASALAWLQSYVPKELAPVLLRTGQNRSLPSEERELSIMFTDLVGFTTISEHLTAQQTSALINGHLSLAGQAIGAEGGTIDKYIGDAVMAYWGAPQPRPDHAQRAIRAAKAMAEALHEDNKRRREHHEVALRMRIGIHTGEAVVGNMGSAERINYTIIGDSVNTAQRLESLGKNFMGDEDEIVILISEECAKAAQVPDKELLSLGAQSLKGRNETCHVFLLKTTATGNIEVPVEA